MATGNPISTPHRCVRLFAKFLSLSGLTFIVMPILGWLANLWDPPQNYSAQAQRVRAVARETGSQNIPILFDDRQFCAACQKTSFMLVQPENTCFECWSGS
jgi:hypothetical protein